MPGVSGDASCAADLRERRPPGDAIPRRPEGDEPRESSPILHGPNAPLAKQYDVSRLLSALAKNKTDASLNLVSAVACGSIDANVSCHCPHSRGQRSYTVHSTVLAAWPEADEPTEALRRRSLQSPCVTSASAASTSSACCLASSRIHAGVGSPRASRKGRENILDEYLCARSQRIVTHVCPGPRALATSMAPATLVPEDSPSARPSSLSRE